MPRQSIATTSAIGIAWRLKTTCSGQTEFTFQATPLWSRCSYTPGGSRGPLRLCIPRRRAVWLHRIDEGSWDPPRRSGEGVAIGDGKVGIVTSRLAPDGALAAATGARVTTFGQTAFRSEAREDQESFSRAPNIGLARAPFIANDVT